MHALFVASEGLYALALGAAFGRLRAGRWLLGVGLSLHLAGTVWRGVAIDFLPLTNKMESFSAAAMALAVVGVVTWKRERLYDGVLVLLAAVALGVALSFPFGLGEPPPLMRTIWYPLHVPLSFVAYALWAGAAAASVVYFRRRDEVWLARVDQLALQGFAIWTVSMVFGGIWGVVAWGAYFMWDPKVIWSVILWFHYASFVHVKLAPTLARRPWLRPALALAGFAWVMVAYVGTSFFFGRSSHAWG